MGLGLEAFLWGIGSAISLPLGAVVGILWRPKQKINSAFMAFGAGALLFALTIELFGHVPHHVEEHGLKALVAAIVGALLGGFLFDSLNHVLNNRGAYMRKFSSAKDYVLKLRFLNQKKMVAQFSKIKILSELSPDIMAMLIRKVDKVKYPAHHKIFVQGDIGDSMYFLSEGEVEVHYHENGQDKKIATLKEGDTFGEMGVISDSERSADIITVTPVTVFRINKKDLDDLISQSPDLKEKVTKLIATRSDDLASKSDEFSSQEWQHNTLMHLRGLSQNLSAKELHAETAGHAAGGGAAMAIWLGLLIDSIPESLVIGMLLNSATGMSLAFIAGVFLANLPEAMSSSVSMNKSGLSIFKISMLWWSIVIVTGLGAYFGAVLFPANATGNMFYFILGIEGLAAGAMLTMIAETMLPEAFEQGGAIVGLSTLLGFLAALSVKVI